MYSSRVSLLPSRSICVKQGRVHNENTTILKWGSEHINSPWQYERDKNVRIATEAEHLQRDKLMISVCSSVRRSWSAYVVDLQ